MSVATLITDWRTGVITHLQTELTADVATVVPGERIGVVREDKDIVCVWWPGWDEITRDTILQQPSLLLRYCVARSKAPSTETPSDPTSLETAAGRLLAALPRATQKSGFFTAGIACRLTSLRPDYRTDHWHVDATLLGYTALEGA